MTTINEIAKLSKVSAAAAYEVLHENAESTVSEETKPENFSGRRNIKLPINRDKTIGNMAEERKLSSVFLCLKRMKKEFLIES
jgi:hypothetical protein